MIVDYRGFEGHRVEYLSSGKSYQVLGILVSGSKREYRLISDWDHLVDVCSAHFEITEPTLPGGWVVSAEGQELRIWYALFDAPHFQEDFNERAPGARAQLEKVIRSTN